MSFRADSASRVERVVSVAAAIALTAAAGLFAALAPGQGFLSSLGQRREAEPQPDRVVYVAAPRPDAVPRTPVEQLRTREAGVRSRPREAGAVASSASVDLPNSALIDSGGIREVNDRLDPARVTTPKGDATANPRVSAGAPAAAAVVGFTKPSAPIRFDSAIGEIDKRFKEGVLSGFLKPPPPTQAEIDAKWRAKAFEAIVARGAGVPVRTLVPLGGVSVPLPFGGPSRKQRERDRAIFAELQKSVALRQQKAESIATARKRRVDSLAQLADSGRRPRNY